ncbi:hypothetical protein NEIRO03_2427 [Nematocida sp. AWRm78]|nr:hypothetical protein NEIRO03_2427 [Nematocida sp. AWRm78]
MHFSLAQAHEIIKSTLYVKLAPRIQKLVGARYTVYIDGYGMVDLARCTALKLGYTKMSIGYPDLYLMLRIEAGGESAQVADADLVSRLSRLLAGSREVNRPMRKGVHKNVPDSAEETGAPIEGTVQVRNFRRLFGAMAGLFKGYHAFIHVRSFGNKADTTSGLHGYHVAVNKLADSFDLRRVPSLLLDVCVSACPERDELLLATPALYESMCVRPTHSLFYCDLFKNCNFSAVELEHHSAALRFRRVFFQKLNCYSSVEDAVASECSRRFVPKYAAAMLMERLYGHMMLGASTRPGRIVRDDLNLLCDLRRCSTERSCSFRLEARVNLFQLDSTVRYLAAQVNKQHFVAMDHGAFCDVFSASVARFRDAITGCAADNAHWTFADVFSSCAAEIVYISRFITGGTNMHMLGTAAKHASSGARLYSRTAFAVPPVATIVDQVRRAVADPQAALLKLVDAIPTNLHRSKATLRTLLLMNKSSDREKVFIDLCYSEATGGLVGGWDALAGHIADYTISSKCVIFSWWLAQLLTKRKNAAWSEPIHAAHALLVAAHGGSREAANAALLRRMDELNIAHVFVPRIARRAARPVLARLTRVIIDADAYGAALAEAVKLRANFSVCRLGSTPEEMGQMLHGFMLFSGSINSHLRVQNCLAYDFFFRRSDVWLKNRLYSFETFYNSVPALRDSLARARAFDPLARTFDELVQEMGTWNYEVDGDALVALRQLYDLEREHLSVLMESTNQAALSDYDILASFMRDEQLQRLLARFDLAKADLSASPVSSSAAEASPVPSSAAEASPVSSAAEASPTLAPSSQFFYATPNEMVEDDPEVPTQAHWADDDAYDGAFQADGSGCNAPNDWLSSCAQHSLPAFGPLPTSAQLSLPPSFPAQDSPSPPQHTLPAARRLHSPAQTSPLPAVQRPLGAEPIIHAPSSAALLGQLREKYKSESFTLRSMRPALFPSGARPPMAVIAELVEELLLAGDLVVERTVRGCRYIYCRAAGSDASQPSHASGDPDGPVQRSATRLYDRLCKLFLHRAKQSFTVSDVQRKLFKRDNMPSKDDLIAMLEALVHTRKLKLSVGPRHCNLYTFSAED